MQEISEIIEKNEDSIYDLGKLEMIALEKDQSNSVSTHDYDAIDNQIKVRICIIHFTLACMH